MRRSCDSWPAAEPLERSSSRSGDGRAAGPAHVLGLVVVWYLSSIVALTTAKLTVNALPAPLILCASQFATATTLTACILRAQQQQHAPSKPPGEAAAAITRRLAAAYTLGFVFTNAALAHAPAPFVETVKSAEPLSTVLLAALLLGERESAAAYCSLLPVCAGVGMASLSGGSGGGVGSQHVLAILLSLAANFGFSGRAVLAKRLRQAQAGGSRGSGGGGGGGGGGYSGSGSNSGGGGNSASGGGGSGKTGSGGGGGGAGQQSDVRLFFSISWMGASALLPAALLVDGGAVLGAPTGFAWGGYAAGLAVNGVAYSVYNLLSFMVLSCVSVTTHAVLNAVRRLVMILFTGVYFGEPRTLVNTAGVLVAVAGVCGYALASARHAPAAPHRTEAFDRTL